MSLLRGMILPLMTSLTLGGVVRVADAGFGINIPKAGDIFKQTPSSIADQLKGAQDEVTDKLKKATAGVKDPESLKEAAKAAKDVASDTLKDVTGQLPSNFSEAAQATASVQEGIAKEISKATDAVQQGAIDSIDSEKAAKKAAEEVLKKTDSADIVEDVKKKSPADIAADFHRTTQGIADVVNRTTETIKKETPKAQSFLDSIADRTAGTDKKPQDAVAIVMDATLNRSSLPLMGVLGLTLIVGAGFCVAKRFKVGADPRSPMLLSDTLSSVNGGAGTGSGGSARTPALQMTGGCQEPYASF